jgi:FkbM family methyltransferase
LSWIGGFERGGNVRVAIRRHQRVIVCELRAGNAADYLVAGEMVRGGYSLPVEIPVKPTGIVDGGANIGMFALQASARFPGLPITCYEPDKDNLVQLRRNLEANNIAAEVIPKALWSKTAELFFHPGQSYSGFVSTNPSPYPISCVLPVVPDGCWLKLDIEAAEYEVLPALLEAGPKPAIISMEIHDFNRRGDKLLSLLQAHGYSWNESFQPSDQCVTICAIKC